MYVTCHCHNNGKSNHREEAPMSKKAATAAKASVYQIVTDRIIASLKAGVIPWEKPWLTPHFAGGPFPRNFRTGKPYRGINIMLLWSSSYSSPFWLTFNQAKELNGSVRKGEKGTQIVFYKQLRDHQKTDDEQTAEEVRRAPFVLTYHTVFNVEQCDGLTLPHIEQPTEPKEVEVDETCEAIVSGWSNRPSLQLISEMEYRAYYRPSTDSVHMPARARFVDAAHYYSTLFHELIHSTGHETRLNRAFGRVLETSFTARRNWLRKWERHFCAQSPASQARTPNAIRRPTFRIGYPSWRRITVSLSMPPQTLKELSIRSSVFRSKTPSS
jgi:antirestriction protein ArdC